MAVSSRDVLKVTYAQAKAMAQNVNKRSEPQVHSLKASVGNAQKTQVSFENLRQICADSENRSQGAMSSGTGKKVLSAGSKAMT